MPSRLSKSRRRFLAGVVTTACMLCAPGPAVTSPDDAAELVREVIAETTDVLRQTANGARERETHFRRLLAQYFDLALITRFVVGRHWRSANDGQKREFAQVFEQHIVKVYASRLSGYQDEKIEIRNITARTERDTIVATEVIRDTDDPLRLDWLVRKRDGGYKIIDVAAEGVSMLASKRSEFSSVIAREGMDGLIDRLHALNLGEIPET